MKTFKKSDFKTGMRVLLQNGDYKFVFIGSNRIYFTNNTGDYTTSEYLNSNLLKDDGGNDFGIMKIYDKPKSENEYFNINILGCLLWDRKEEETIFEHKGIKWSESTLKSMIDKYIK